MTKITVDEIAEAVTKTGKELISKDYYKDDNGGAMCPLGHLFFADPKTSFSEPFESTILMCGEIETWAQEKYGRVYVEGFINGVDNDPHNYSVTDSDADIYWEGRNDGEKIREVLFS